MNLKLFARWASAALCGLFLLAGNSIASAQPYELMFGGYTALGGNPVPVSVNSDPKPDKKLNLERNCLAKAIYFEARGESELGQVAVAQVILNRVKSQLYPDSVCRVVWQNATKRNACQFSFACDGKSDNPKRRRAWQKAKNIARDMLVTTRCYEQLCSRLAESLDKSTQQSTHYHANYVSPRWSRKLIRVRNIGQHIFYISPRVQAAQKKGS